METRKTLLRDVNDNDFLVLFKWRNSKKYIDFVHSKTDRSNTLNEFINEFKIASKDRKFQFIIESKLQKLPIGIIFTHTYTTDNSFCFVNLFIEKEFEKKGYGADAFSLMLTYLFEVCSLYKVYVEVCELNRLCHSSLKTAGLIEEGIFYGHKVIEGIRYNVIRFAAYEQNSKRLKDILSH